jgi:DNA invertase Pin-like site-specific DNA recombinase
MPSTNGHGSTPERVALYLRVSSEEQRDAGTIQTQRNYLERYAAERGFEVIETYSDDGVSGTYHLHERREGLRLFEDAQAGKLDTVLVYRLDRLARTHLGIQDAADRLECLKVALRSATEHYETATPQGRLLYQMLSSFAEFERSTIKQRTRDGLHREYGEGHYMGRAPFGYRADGHGHLQVVLEEAEIVRQIFEHIAASGTLKRARRAYSELEVPQREAPTGKSTEGFKQGLRLLPRARPLSVAVPEVRSVRRRTNREGFTFVAQCNLLLSVTTAAISVLCHSCSWRFFGRLGGHLLN